MKIKLRSESKFDAAISDDRLMCSCSDGGDSAPAAPTQQTVTQTNLPEWARPYAEDIFQRGSALSKSGYVPYSGQRIAQFTPMQQQAFVGAQEMQPSAQLQQATNQALGMQYDPYQTGQFTSPVASQYMNPYMQNVVDVQKREASRQSDILRNQQQAQAVNAGAFGGSRQAIVEAERQRNLAQQLGDIQTTGSNAAYNQAMQQFNQEQQLREQSRQYGAGLGLQGAQLGMQGAGQLFQQGTDINKLQQLYGTQQQQAAQDVLSQQYQDFLNQQNYPYKQLGFMSDLLRGTGQLSGTTGASVYQAPPSVTSQLTGLGTAALGLSGLAKSGMFGSKKGGKITEAKARKVNKAAGLADLALSKLG